MRKYVAMMLILLVMLTASTSSYAFFGSKDKKEVASLQEQMTLQTNELQKTIDGLKGELATTKKQVEDANKMIKSLNEKLGSAEFAINDYKAKLEGAPAVEGAVAGAGETGESKLSGMMNKMKDAMTPNTEVCEMCGEIKGSENCCKDAK